LIEQIVTQGACLLRVHEPLIDERVDLLELVPPNCDAVAFDLEKVRAITSQGLQGWLRGLEQLKAGYYAFVNCNRGIVDRFNTVERLGHYGNLISFYAPYTCNPCSKEVKLLIDLRHDHGIAATKTPPRVRCPECELAAEFDDAPDTYFWFAGSRPAPQPPPVVERLIAGDFKHLAKKGSLPSASHAGDDHRQKLREARETMAKTRKRLKKIFG
jgi:DNA-directed RNA polymerase subunit RPC12/RpoP